MALFGRKEKVPRLPSAPRLPELPDLSSYDDSFGREMVKSAVSDSSGEREVRMQELPRDFKFDESVSVEEPAAEEEPIPEVPEEAAESGEEGGQGWSEVEGGWKPEEQGEVIESVEMIPQKPRKQRVRVEEIVETEAEEPAEEAPTKRAVSGPVFVRVDKFEQALKEFDMIQRKLRETESVLKRIIDAKVREDEQLKAWMDDLAEVKSKISEIDRNIFRNYGE